MTSHLPEFYKFFASFEIILIAASDHLVWHLSFSNLSPFKDTYIQTVRTRKVRFHPTVLSHTWEKNAWREGKRKKNPASPFGHILVVGTWNVPLESEYFSWRLIQYGVEKRKRKVLQKKWGLPYFLRLKTYFSYKSYRSTALLLPCWRISSWKVYPSKHHLRHVKDIHVSLTARLSHHLIFFYLFSVHAQQYLLIR